MRSLLYSYSQILGLIKLFLYKLIFGKDLVLKGLPHNSHKATIRIRKGGRMIIGSNTRIMEGNYIWVTKGAELSIGSNTTINVNCIISCREKIIIGNNVMFGPYVTVYDCDHDTKSNCNMNDSGYVSAPVIIEDNVWIGNQVKILKGVTIGKGSVVAAGSTVNKSIPANSVFYNKKEDVYKSRA